MLEPSEERKEIPKIILDTQIASALGNGLEGYFDEPLKQAWVANNAIRKNLPDNAFETEHVASGINNIRDFITNLRTSQRVFIVRGSWNVEFDPEKKPAEMPPESIETDSDITRFIIAAVNHFCNNQLSGLSFADQIDNASLQNIIDMIPGAQKQMANTVIEKFPVNAESLKFTTDKSGKTTIEPVLKKK